jgi:chromosome segregation ATPase
MSGLAKQMEDDKKCIEAIQNRANEAEEEAKTKADEIKEALAMAKKEEESIDECTMSITALEEECARLKKKWEELKIERKVREEEKAQKENAAEQSREERIRLQEEIQRKKEEYQAKLKEVENVERERTLLKSNLNDLENERMAREAEEAEYTTELKFLQMQFDAVKLRVMEKKQ